MNKARKITHLKAFVRSATYSAYGLAKVTEAEATAMVDTLIEMGKLQPTEGRALLDNLMLRVRKSGEVFREKIDRATAQMLTQLEESCVTELDELTERIQHLQTQVNALPH